MIMSMVKWEKDGTVAIMIMNQGENLHNPTWAQAMLDVYAEIVADPEIKALVLTSSDPKNFSLGVDLGWVINTQQNNDFQAMSDWLYLNNEVFKAMLMAPFPTIAAITGHAFGNGAILAGACDFRFMRSDRGYYSLPEVNLGIQFAPSMVEWMRRIMPYPFFIRMMLTGDRFTAPILAEQGIIVKACEDSEKTLAEAVAYAKTFTKSRTTVEEMKKRVYKHIIDKMETEDQQYYDYRPELIEEGKLPVFMMTPLT